MGKTAILPLLSEFGIRLIEQIEHVFMGESELLCFDSKLCCQRFQSAQPFRAGQAGAFPLDIAASSAYGSENPIALEVSIGMRHRVRVDTEFGCQFTDRGQEIARIQSAGGNRVLYLLLNL